MTIEKYFLDNFSWRMFDTTPEIIDKIKRSPDSSTPNEFDNLAVKPIFDRS